MSEKWDAASVIGAVVIAAIFGSLAITLGGGWVALAKIESQTWAAWAQAVISGAAIFVAVTQAGKAGKRQASKEDDLAALAAAVVVDHVDQTLDILRNVQTVLGFEDFYKIEDARFLNEKLQSCCTVSAQITRSDLVDLMVLPNHLAPRLAKAIAVIKSQSVVVSNDLSRFIVDRNGLLKPHQIMIFKGWIHRIDEAVDLLLAIRGDLIKASKRASPHPTGEELYGGG